MSTFDLSLVLKGLAKCVSISELPWYSWSSGAQHWLCIWMTLEAWNTMKACANPQRFWFNWCGVRLRHQCFPFCCCCGRCFAYLFIYFLAPWVILMLSLSRKPLAWMINRGTNGGKERESSRVSGPQTFWSIDHFMGVLKEIGLFRISGDNCIAVDETPVSERISKWVIRGKFCAESNFTVCFPDTFMVFKVPSSKFTNGKKMKTLWE